MARLVAAVVACALVALMASTALAAQAQKRTTTSATCTVSNGVLTLYNTPRNVQCVSRSDVPSSYIKSGGNIDAKFIFGATVTPHSLKVTVSFYFNDDCTGPAGSIQCVNLPDTRCVLDTNGKPVLTNVGPPAVCAKRGDTNAAIKFTTGMTAINVPLGAAVAEDFCPIQVNLFKDEACTLFLATQEIDCPCQCPTYN